MWTLLVASHHWQDLHRHVHEYRTTGFAVPYLTHIAVIVVVMADSVEELLVKVRTQLFHRGITSTGTIIRACARADSSGNKLLDRTEFDEVLKSVGVFVSSQELGLLFRRFDKTGDGSISYDEFLTAIKVWDRRGILVLG